MKKSFSIIVLGLLLSFQAHSGPLPLIVDRNVKEVIFKLFNELPARFKEGLPHPLQIEVSDLGAIELKKICQTDLKFSIYDPQKKKIIINKQILNIINSSENYDFACKHRSIKSEILGSITRNLATAYDENSHRPSHEDQFLYLSNFKETLISAKNKNKERVRVSNQLERGNYEDFFASNLEYFLLDDEFACRRPTLHEYFKKMFEVDPFPMRKCKINTSVLLTTNNGAIPYELDMSRVFRIDYLLADSGNEIDASFGHSMFRVVMCAPERFDPVTNSIIPKTPMGPECLKDKLYHLVFSFRANVQEANLNFVKGLFGGYPTNLFILNLSDVLASYNKEELRDVISYPLDFTKEDRERFIIRAIEQHWSYSGNYKFITNNCATEVLDFIKGIFPARDYKIVNSITPKGVLKDLVYLKLLRMNNTGIEKYNSNADQLLVLSKKFYESELLPGRVSRSDFFSLADNTTPDEHREKYENFLAKNAPRIDLHSTILSIQEKIKQSAEFSLIEQQIQLLQTKKLTKKIANDYFITKNSHIKSKIDELNESANRGILSNSKGHYGIPFAEELMSKLQIDEVRAQNSGTVKELDTYYQQLFEDDFKRISGLRNNVQTMNEGTLALRKELRNQLEKYLKDVIVNMAYSFDQRQVLIAISHGQRSGMLKLRAILGEEIVSEKEVSDAKLLKIINETLKEIH